MRVHNYTPHEVRVIAADGTEYVYPPSGKVARVAMKTMPCAPLADGCPVSVPDYGEAELPEPVRVGDACIVSTMFADAFNAQGRAGLFYLLVPDSGPDAIRENGQIKAVRRLLAK